MESMVKTDEDETHIGIPICEGPRQFRMVLTRPYHEAGHIIEIPREDITSVELVAPGSLGGTPEPADQNGQSGRAAASG